MFEEELKRNCLKKVRIWTDGRTPAFECTEVSSLRQQLAAITAERDDALHRANNSISAEGAAKLLIMAVTAESRANAAEAANVRLRVALESLMETAFGSVGQDTSGHWGFQPDYEYAEPLYHAATAAQAALKETEVGT